MKQLRLPIFARQRRQRQRDQPQNRQRRLAPIGAHARQPVFQFPTGHPVIDYELKPRNNS
jgi:hypothetical protein